MLFESQYVQINHQYQQYWQKEQLHAQQCEQCMITTSKWRCIVRTYVVLFQDSESRSEWLTLSNRRKLSFPFCFTSFINKTKKTKQTPKCGPQTLFITHSTKKTVKQFSHPCYVHNAVKYLYAEPEEHFSLFVIKPHAHQHTCQLYMLINLFRLLYGIKSISKQ